MGRIITVYYFQRGSDSTWIYECRLSKAAGTSHPVVQSDPDCPLSEQVRAAFHQARDAELQRIVAAGLSYDLQFEGRDIYGFHLPLEK